MKNLPIKNSQHYLYLDWLRALAIVGVVFIHTFDPFVTQPWGQVVSVSQIVLAGLARFAVPMYVMISGALLLGKQEPIRDFYIKRMSRVAIPLLTWSGIFLLWYSWNNPGFSWYDAVFRLILFGQPFYLIFVLLGLYVITPFLRTYVKAAASRELVYAAGLCLVLSCLVSLLQEWLIAPNNILPLFSISYFVFFIGYYLAGYVLHQNLIKPSRVWVWFLGGYLVTVLGTLGFEQTFGVDPKGLIWWGYLSPSVVVMTLGLFVMVKKYSLRLESWGAATKVMRLLAANSLAIYFSHQLLLDAFAAQRHKLLGFSFGTAITTFALALFSSLLLSLLFKKIPRLAFVLGLPSVQANTSAAKSRSF